jgi:hypothetical protein
LSPGSYAFVATYGGAYGLGKSTSSTFTLVVSQPPASTTTITTPVNPLAYGLNPALTIQVVASQGSPVPAGMVTLTQNGVAVTGSPFTLGANGTVTYTATGLTPGVGVTASYTFVATYQGSYTSAISTGTLVVVVNPPPPDFTLSLASTSGTINFHNSIADTLTITPVPYSGYSAATVLTCTGAPSSGQCLIVPGSVTPNGGPVTATVTLSTGSLVTSLRSSRSNLVLAWSVFGALALLGLGTGRRRRWPRLLAALVCLSMLAAASGCSTSSNSNYTLTIEGIGSTGQGHLVTWTVQVTQ